MPARACSNSSATRCPAAPAVGRDQLEAIFQDIQSDLRFDHELNGCLNCGICTATCPSAHYYDYSPREIGDGTTGSGQQVTHTFTTVGTYTVLLTVTDSRGKKAETTKAVPVKIPVPPSAGD